VKTGIKKVVLAYSGGLDTSVILKWLQDRYGCEVITFHRRHRPGGGARPRAPESEEDGREANLRRGPA